MNTNFQSAELLINGVVNGLKDPKCTVVIAPPYPMLALANDKIKNSSIKLSAQNCNENDKGAFTGEVSLDMLQSVGVEYVIIGHSERREYFKETNELLAKKVSKVLEKGLTPIFCCGEPLEIRENGSFLSFVCKQIEESTFHLSSTDFSKIIIAYEPIWAIGTGKTASTEQAQEMHLAIRNFISKKYGNEIADNLSILYGGSCNAKNAADLFSQSDVDGGLIGGASLITDDFLTIINAF